MIVWALLVAFLLIWIVSALLDNGEWVCLDRRPSGGLSRTPSFTRDVPGTSTSCLGGGVGFPRFRRCREHGSVRLRLVGCSAVVPVAPGTLSVQPGWSLRQIGAELVVPWTAVGRQFRRVGGNGCAFLCTQCSPVHPVI